MALLTRTRLTVYPLIFLAFYLGVGGVNLGGGLLQGAGLTDLQGKPVGSDFVTFWAGSVLALEGRPEAVYQPAAIKDVVRQATGTALEYPWHYPPVFLLLVLPLGMLPYLWSLAVWLGVTLAAYLGVVRRLAPHPLTLRLALAFPGAFQNFFQGQNGFLSAALLGGGLLSLKRRPWLAGALLGLLTYKPHLALLLPVALLAGRHFRALGGAAASALGVVAVSLLVFGMDTWRAFLANLPFARLVLETGAVPWFKMPTAFAGVLMLGGSAAAAQMVQIAMVLAAACAVAWVWRRRPPLSRQAASLGVGLLLATPFAFDYDLALLAVPLACLGRQGWEEGCPAAEQILLILAYLTPFLAPAAARFLGLPLAPLVLAALLALVVRRVPREAQVSPGGAELTP